MTVEMHPAYVYDCSECGRENFVRAVVHEFSAEDLQELKEEQGVESCETGDFVTIPETVTCDHCDCEFETEYFRET